VAVRGGKGTGDLTTKGTKDTKELGDCQRDSSAPFVGFVFFVVLHFLYSPQ